MALTRDEAWTHLCAWTETDSLRKHARAVELVMRAASARYGGPEADAELWGIAGMLHDGDYEQWPEDHPKRIVAWLRERGEAGARGRDLDALHEVGRRRRRCSRARCSRATS